MLNFIVCSEDKENIEHVNELIRKFMMNNDIEYKVIVFNEYNDEFKKIVFEKIGFKVYFLSNKIKDISGEEAAKIIRRKCDDWSSIIMMINCQKSDSTHEQLYIFDYLKNKDDSIFLNNLDIAIKNYKSKIMCLTFEYNHIIKRIDFDHIVYIEKEQDSKRCIIKSTYGDHIINKNLSETFKVLDNRFFKTSRSMIINLEYVMEYNINQNSILFKNGDIINEIARDNKKKLKNRLLNY